MLGDPLDKMEMYLCGDCYDYILERRKSERGKINGV